MSNIDLEPVTNQSPNVVTGKHLLHSGNVYVGMFPASCDCRIIMPRSQRASDLLTRWLADHPGHVRRDHSNAKDFCEWLDSVAVSGGMPSE